MNQIQRGTVVVWHSRNLVNILFLRLEMYYNFILQLYIFTAHISGRRGLLLPHRLSDVIPVVLQALVFDEPRTYGSIGYLIRDAACYICWSFPRAYDPHVFECYVKEVAAMLLVVTCFDREVQIAHTCMHNFHFHCNTFR